jgi:hypothetical protein
VEATQILVDLPINPVALFIRGEPASAAEASSSPTSVAENAEVISKGPDKAPGTADDLNSREL